MYIYIYEVCVCVDIKNKRHGTHPYLSDGRILFLSCLAAAGTTLQPTVIVEEYGTAVENSLALFLLPTSHSSY